MARSKMTPERYSEIKRMLALGVSIREIMRIKKATRRTIRQIRDGILHMPGEPKELSGPIWASQVNWDEVLQEALNGHPIKYIWSEVAEDKIGYKSFLDQFHRKFPQFKMPGVVHRVFAPGERCEVDYAGGTIEWINVRTGQIHEVPVFIGVLGCSQLIFACARENAKSPNFIDCHVKMYEAFGGTPKVTVPDCLKTGVIKTHLYDPDLNPSYADMATYYNTAIVPARTRKPKDKAIVEGAVKLVMRLLRWKYRKHTFTSLNEINEALTSVTDAINDKIHTRFKVSRYQRWQRVEKEALGSLPAQSYEYTETKTATVHPDCHISVAHNYYSVPHIYRGLKLKVKLSLKQVRVFKDLECVATHKRHHSKDGLFVTNPAHLPPNARAYHEATPQSLLSQARFLSPDLYNLVDNMFKENALGELRRVQGLIRETRKEINLAGHDRAKQVVKKAVETMRLYNKVRVPYFKELLCRFRKENLPQRTSSSIQRKPGNPMLRHTQLKLISNPNNGGKDAKHITP